MKLTEGEISGKLNSQFTKLEIKLFHKYANKALP